MKKSKKTPDPDKPLTDAEWDAMGPTMHGIEGLPPEIRKAFGRPRVASPKRMKSFRLSGDVIAGIEASGKGYNARVEQALREALNTGKI